MYFFVKVRIDVSKLGELGQKLQTGELDKSNIKLTYCLKDDESVGLNIWEADDKISFEKAFAPHKQYYKEIMEIVPVITPAEAQKELMAKMSK